jgi:hypothetical protein
MSRALLFVALLGCAHEPERTGTSSSSEPSADVVPSQLIIGAAEGTSPDAVLAALALDGFRFEYLAAASGTTHLVKVTALDGSALDAGSTADVAKRLEGRAGVRFVELNHRREPR